MTSFEDSTENRSQTRGERRDEGEGREERINIKEKNTALWDDEEETDITACILISVINYK